MGNICVCEIWVHFSSRDVLNFLWNMHSLSWYFLIFFIPWMTVAFVIFEERISLAPLMSYTLPRTRIWVTPIQILNLRLVQAWYLCLNLQSPNCNSSPIPKNWNWNQNYSSVQFQLCNPNRPPSEMKIYDIKE